MVFPQSLSQIALISDTYNFVECWRGGWATRGRTWAATSRWTTFSPGLSTGQTFRRWVTESLLLSRSKSMCWSIHSPGSLAKYCKVPKPDINSFPLIQNHDLNGHLTQFLFRRTLFLSWLRRCPINGQQVKIIESGAFWLIFFSPTVNGVCDELQSLGVEGRPVSLFQCQVLNSWQVLALLDNGNSGLFIACFMRPRRCHFSRVGWTPGATTSRVIYYSGWRQACSVQKIKVHKT